jgi:hypothetical protein
MVGELRIPPCAPFQHDCCPPPFVKDEVEVPTSEQTSKKEEDCESQEAKRICPQPCLPKDPCPSPEETDEDTCQFLLLFGLKA